MATAAANKRLTREYKAISENPPPYIQAHPSENNILEWHYLLTGPPDTPYHNGQYWGTLTFPPEYPFKPPAIRMLTPSGRFQTATRLCLSISDFHPKSFNPAWEVSTILIGLLSFMTSDEMTTGSVSTGETERRVLAARSRWWNSTGGGSAVRRPDGTIIDAPGTAAAVGGGRGGGKMGLGDGGRRFRAEWEDVDGENWKWIDECRVNPFTGMRMEVKKPEQQQESSSSPMPGSSAAAALRRRAGIAEGGHGHGSTPAEAVVRRGEGWLRRNRVWVGLAVVVSYVLLARAFE